MVNMQQYDLHLAQAMENGLNYMAVAFAMQLVQRFCVDDKSTNQLNEVVPNIQLEHSFPVHVPFSFLVPS